jgi:hypothetical protein
VSRRDVLLSPLIWGGSDFFSVERVPVKSNEEVETFSSEGSISNIYLKKCANSPLVKYSHLRVFGKSNLFLAAVDTIGTISDRESNLLAWKVTPHDV